MGRIVRRRFVPGRNILTPLNALITKTLKPTPTQSSRCDDIDPCIAAALIDKNACLLTEIITCSIRVGEVPADIKRTKVVPIYKQGFKMETANYRPVSVLPFFSKLFVRVVYDRLRSCVNRAYFSVQLMTICGVVKCSLQL